jgi:hypothetical protein
VRLSPRNYTILISKERLAHLTHSKLGLFILASGKVVSAMAKGNKLGQMELNTLENGKKTELMAKVDLSM